MKNGQELYKRIGKRETLSQRWNDLTDEERMAYTKIAEGVEVGVKRGETVREIAKYLMNYTKVKEIKQYENYI